MYGLKLEGVRLWLNKKESASLVFTSEPWAAMKWETKDEAEAYGKECHEKLVVEELKTGE